jgi:MFS superfamily sulfate permease-like transporter
MSETPPASPTPPGDLNRHWVADLLSGFLVFLIALPLCLGISLASGYPPIAGIFTAIIGGVLTTFLSNSQLTIKGPAAGLIVIAIGAVTELGQEFGTGLEPAQQMALGYRLALGIGVAAGVIQILFGLCKAGRLGDFFPTAAVHGMLASIGIIIIAKQLPVALGVTDAKGEPLHLLARLPEFISRANPEIAVIGLVSLAILFGLPWIRHPLVKRIPAPMVVLLLAIPLGSSWCFDLDHEHTYLFNHHEYHLDQNFLVNLPPSLAAGIATPDFRGVMTLTGLKYVVMFALIGSLESLLSAKAIDMLDPWKRTTDLNRDMLAVGLANTVSASVGGLPMISEIVRSKANIDNGARTRFANMFHGLFLLAFVALLPGVIHSIPLAALAGMLVYTGFRLASPSEFRATYRVGREQFVIFVGTILATLATDLLIGIAVGIAIKWGFHFWHGLHPRQVFVPTVRIHETGDGPTQVSVTGAVVFSNWLPLKAKLEELGKSGDLVLDFSEAGFVDHTVMEKLHELERAFGLAGRCFRVTGLDGFDTFSDHPCAARKRPRKLAGTP